MVLLIAIAWLFSGDRWYVSLNSTSDEPYGISYFKETLKDQTSTKKTDFTEILEREEDEFLSDDLENSTYIFIGNVFYEDSIQKKSLLDFINRGNTAFISAKEGPYSILDSLFFSDSDTDYYQEKKLESLLTAEIKIDDFKKTLFIRNKTDTVFHTWNSINLPESANINYEKLGMINEETNLVKINIGDGELYIHTTPEVFTNYFFIQEGILEYYNSLFRKLKYQNYIWDERSKYHFYEQPPNFYNQQRSPLVEFLKIKGFKYAWYTMLFMVLILVIFGAKRKQRIIPILKEKENTSKSFVENIGTLYYQTNDNAQLGKLKTKLFNLYIFERYHLQFKEENVEKIQKLSGVNLNTINEILKRQKSIEYLEKVTNDYLVNYHLEIEKFIENGK